MNIGNEGDVRGNSSGGGGGGGDQHPAVPSRKGPVAQPQLQSTMTNDDDDDDVVMEAAANADEEDGVIGGSESKRRRTKDLKLTSNATSSSSTEMESPEIDVLFSSMTKLLSGVKSIVSSLAESDEGAIAVTTKDYSRIYELGSEASEALANFGNDVELALLPDNDNDKGSITDEERVKLRDIGRNLWMAVRSHPQVFLDNDINTTATINDASSSSEEEGRDAVVRATSTGFVRYIAARMILVDYIITQGQNPVRKMSATGRLPSLSELEFGMRSFIRSGRSLLHKGPIDARHANTALLLAIDAWNSITYIAQGGTGDASDAIAAASVTSKNLDDVFDGFLVLPDAACSLVNASVVRGSEAQQKVVRELNKLDEFLRAYCITSVQDGEDRNDSGVSLRAIQRYLPLVARSAYKHGNRFAQLKDFANANAALKIVMRATDDCLRGIRSRKTDASSQTLSRALNVQETEMLVLAKQSLYIISHVRIEEGRPDDADAALDQVERYIDEEKANSELQYSTATRSLNSDTKSKLGLDLLEGPNIKDKSDIKARLDTARSQAEQIELRERANLAFSRIMLYHKVSPHGREDGSKVDAQFKALIGLVLSISDNNVTKTAASRPSSRQLGTMTTTDGRSAKRKAIEISQEDAFSDLLLRAAREIRTRRLVASNADVVSCIANPYEMLLERVNRRHPKHLFVILDHLRAVLTAIQLLREKHNNESIITDLDDLALEIAKQYDRGFKSLASASGSNSNSNSNMLPSTESTLFDGSSTSSATKQMRQDLLKQSRTQFSRALALYHCADDRHRVCHQWADYLIESVKGEDYGGSTTDTTLAELFSIKAYALSMSGETMTGLRTARKAWEVSERSDSPSLHVFGILFHAALRQESSDERNGSNDRYSTFDPLLELDNGISCLFRAYGNKKMDSGRTIGEELLELFKALCRGSMDHGTSRSSLGLHERWIKLFGKTRPVIEMLQNGYAEDTGSGKAFTDVPGGASMLKILRSYINTIQNTIVNEESGSSYTSIVQPEALDNVLEGVLSIICTVRDRKISIVPKAKAKTKSKSSKKTIVIDDDNEEFTLIWDNSVTKKILGLCPDAIWIAEQLWGLANLFSKDKWIMSQLYARAHDFALLSEEEEGEKLTAGFLDCDYGCTAEAEIRVPDFSRSGKSCEAMASSLSSEFSAHCLIISVANTVDDVERADAANKDWAQRALHRLALAYAEIEANELHDEHNRQEVRPLLAHLTLRCLVELGNDERAQRALADGSLLKCLRDKNVARDDDRRGPDDEEDQATTETNEVNSSSMSMLQNLRAMAARAEENGLRQTARLILQSCIDECKENNGSTLQLASESSLISIGELQKKQLELASTIEETIAVFKAVNESVKVSIDDIAEGSADSGASTPPYSKDQMDWFAIEAYNRGCTLMSLGDVPNAIRLVEIALNALPFCSKAVESYGPDMRGTYSKLSMCGDRLNAVGHGYGFSGSIVGM